MIEALTKEVWDYAGGNRWKWKSIGLTPAGRKPPGYPALQSAWMFHSSLQKPAPTPPNPADGTPCIVKIRTTKPDRHRSRNTMEGTR
jgi:hypothetical protein